MPNTTKQSHMLYCPWHYPKCPLPQGDVLINYANAKCEKNCPGKGNGNEKK